MTREYDTTQLHMAGHGKNLHRDYTAHFFRWSFARRYVKPTDNVLEVGCGEEMPLRQILFGGAGASANTYTGVDLNKLKEFKHKRSRTFGEFNFVERWKELLESDPDYEVDEAKGYHPQDVANGYDVVIHMEVFEHMNEQNGLQFMEACYNVVKPGGVMIVSTPVWDHVRMAKNHIREYDVQELKTIIENAGFTVEKRFGTFMDIKHIGKPDLTGIDKEVAVVYNRLKEYFDNNALSNFFGPLYPDHARNNLWICRK
jgi:SAM-dependent methyltransferase